MNDRKTHQFTEKRFRRKKQTKKDIKEFILQKRKPKNFDGGIIWLSDYLELHDISYIVSNKTTLHDEVYGIFVKKNRKHIGNIKLGPIDYNHKFAWVSYFIGSDIYRNKGYASQSVYLIKKIAKKLKIRKLQAECYKKNIGSIKVLLKNKFKLEGVLKKQIILNKKRSDRLIFGVLL